MPAYSGRKSAYDRDQPETPTRPTNTAQVNGDARCAAFPTDPTEPTGEITQANNPNNEPVLNYSRLSYLEPVVARVIKSIMCSYLPSTSLIMILDGGIIHHMFGNKVLLTIYSAIPSIKFVILGDGITTISISGE